MASKNYHVQTVLGPVDVRELGRTLTHEHISASIAQNLDIFYRKAPEEVINLPNFDDTVITLDNVGLVRQYPYSNFCNMELQDDITHRAMQEDMQIFKDCGGGCIVENTCHGIGRDFGFMVDASKATGVHVVAGTGFYVKEAHSEAFLQSSVEELAKIMRGDMLGGSGEFPDVKCGVIAEVGSGWPISEFERRAIQATAIVQAEMGCGVSFHPGRDKSAPEEIARIYLEAGGDKEKAVISHLDRTLHTKEDILTFAETGLYCQYDLFGLETSLYQLNTMVDMPSDAQRIQRIKWLTDAGFEDKILVSHDVHSKHRLMKFGGHGFAHILLTVVPQMKVKGISQEVIDKILMKNPQAWMGIDPEYQSRSITLL